MLDGAQHARFGEEALGPFLVSCDLRLEHLHRGAAPDGGMQGLIDQPHATGGQELDHLEAAQVDADQRISLLHLN